MGDKTYRVLLYYKYVHIDNPEELTKDHLKFCKDLGLKGRILIAEEGINGTVSGTVEQTDNYMEELRSDPRFKDIEFKIDEADGHAFKKMHVRHRSEIVSLRLEDDIDPNELTGNYLEPKEFKKLLEDENTIVLDARNDYEYDLGHFRGAIRPDIKTFKELPDWVKENKDMLEGKQILTYCTGGIRCEKFSGWLKKKALRMLTNFMAVLPLTVKTQKFKVSFGTVRCTCSMSVSAFRLTRKNTLWLVVTTSQVNLVSVM